MNQQITFTDIAEREIQPEEIEAFSGKVAHYYSPAENWLDPKDACDELIWIKHVERDEGSDRWAVDYKTISGARIGANGTMYLYSGWHTELFTDRGEE